LDVVLSSDDTKFQMSVLLRSDKYLRRDALLLHFVKKAPASVLADALNDERLIFVNWIFGFADGATRILLERLELLMRSNDPADRDAALDGMKTCLEIARRKQLPANCTRKALSLLGEMIETCMADGAATGQFGRGLEHLAAAVGARAVMTKITTWDDLPEPIRRLSRQSLLLLNDPEYHAQAVDMLSWLQFYAHYFRWEENATIMRKDAELMAALAQARRKVMKEGTVGDQVAVLIIEVATQDDKLASAARAELERRLLNGEISPMESGGKPYSLLGRLSDHPTRELKQYMLERLLDRQEMVEVRRSAAYYLGRAYRDDGAELVDIAAGLLEQYPVAGTRLLFPARQWIAQHKDEPRPPWVVKAVNLATGMLKKPGLSPGTKRMLADFVTHCSADKGRVLQAFVLDPTLSRIKRRTAAFRLGELDGANVDFRPFTEHYEDLPFAVRCRIAEVVGKHGTAPGAVDFALRFLKDPETRYNDIRYIVQSESLPNTPELKNARRGARMGLAIAFTIRRMIGRLRRVSQLVR
ncbi:MAG: hypothetical protein HQ592_10750, partial [Planctomycetes bacterium]|nr:hypothetical protein [Planctomycetota bacterium]